MKYFSISLGCPKNRVDTERLLGSLPQGQMVEEIFDADFILLNTCAFIAPAIQESVQTIVAIIEDMKEMQTKPFFAVVGCLAGRFDKKELAKELPEVDLWLEPDTLEDWADIIAQKLSIKAPEKGRIISTLPSYAWLKIGEGCKHACSFCTIPKIRTKKASYPKEFLYNEAKNAVDLGVKEIILVAQDVTAWQEENAKDIRPLLDKLISIDNLERIRLMYLYPSGLTDELLDYISKADKKLLHYFDVPLQHSHEDILKNMGRPFAKNPYDTIEKIRKYMPNASLRTSLIVGFPNEQEEHYEHLCNFVEEVGFNNLGVFAYQAEEGTKAALMENQVEDNIKEWRKDNLMEIQADISEELLKEYFGANLEILIDKRSDEWDSLYIGRAWFQAPEVDGITYISAENIEPAQIVNAEIVETKEYDLVALV